MSGILNAEKRGEDECCRIWLYYSRPVVIVDCPRLCGTIRPHEDMCTQIGQAKAIFITKTYPGEAGKEISLSAGDKLEKEDKNMENLMAKKIHKLQQVSIHDAANLIYFSYQRERKKVREESLECCSEQEYSWCPEHFIFLRDSGDVYGTKAFQGLRSLFSHIKLDFCHMEQNAEEMIKDPARLHGINIRLRNVKEAQSLTREASEDANKKMIIILCSSATVKSTNKLCTGRVDLLVGDKKLLDKNYRQMLGVHATVVESCTVPIPQKLGNRQQLQAELQIIGKEKQFWAHCRSVDGEIALEEEQRLEIGALVGKLLTTGRSLPVSAHWCLATTDGLPHDLEVQVQLFNVNDVAMETIGSQLLTLTTQVSCKETLQ